MIPRVRPPFSLRDLLRAAFSDSSQATGRFELEFADKYGFPHGLFFPYGRSALYSLLRALQWTDEEVLVPAYMCAVVTNAILLSGNRIKFVDNEPDHFNVSAERFSAAMSESTKMVIPTPLFGFPLERSGYEHAIAQKAPRAFVLYDIAQGFGVEDEQGLQTRGADGAFVGLGMGKMLSTIEGGVLLLKDEEVYREVADYRRKVFTSSNLFSGFKRFILAFSTYCALREPFLSFVDFIEEHSGLVGEYGGELPVEHGPFLPDNINEIPTNFQAKLGLLQIAEHDRIIEQRREIASRYNNRLKEAGFQLFSSPALPTYSQYPILVRDCQCVKSAMRKYRIQVKIPYPYSCPDLPGYEKYHGCSPNATAIANRIVTLPIWYGITPATVDRVTDALERCREKEPDLFILE
jgi:dTDP-4-amino-4,6-dideoxygalactose transaminase